MRKTVLTIAVIVAAGFALSAQQSTTKPASRAPAAKVGAKSNETKIREALSAAPTDIAKGAAVMDWGDTPNAPMKELRKGTNGWTCMPSSPGEFGSASVADPMCLDKTFMDWAGAWMAKKDPLGKSAGVGYMLKGDKGASNTDPFATGPTPDNHWVVSPAHVMILVPDPASLNNLPTDPSNGGPWVMWKGTKYAHIMVPVAPMPKQTAVATNGKK